MKNAMLFKVFIAMLLAIVAGWAAGPDAALLGVPYVKIFSLIGQLFLNALSLVIVPLVAASIITGTAKIGSEKSFGTIGLKTLGYFILTSFLAILVGLSVALFISPGVSTKPIETVASPAESAILAKIEDQLQGGVFHKIEQTLFKVIPSNILAAASEGQMMGLIVFCMLFGYFVTKTHPQVTSILLGFWQGVFQVMMQITHLVLKALPIGVFGLVAKAVATAGPESLKQVAYFFETVLLGLGIYSFVILPLLLKCIAGVNPWKHLRAMFPALVTAFSTSSSAATLPVTFECVEKRAGISNRVSSFVLPLGTSINLSGSALFACVSILFIAQTQGVHLSGPTLAMTVAMILISSLGSAGIPSASLIYIVGILHTLGLSPDAIASIMAVERLLDMFRTPVNVFGTSCCAVLVARSEGEKSLLTPQPV